MKRAMRLIGAVTLAVCWLAGLAAGCNAQTQQPPAKWTQPASELAGQIADLLGPGQAQLTVRNVSTIQTSEIPAIRKLIEEDLKARGVLAGGAESANTIRVTLSENARERLWVAEVVEGNETRVTMVHVDAAPVAATSTRNERVVLRKEKIPGLINRIGGTVQDNPILTAAEI